MALFSRVHTWVSNEVLTAAALNAEFDNGITNSVATSIVGYSANSSQMQTVADPGGVGTESLAGSVAEEITRLRYAVKRIAGGAQWYVAPIGTLGALGIPAAALAADSVTTTKIIDGALSADTTGRAKMADGFNTAAKMAANSVGTSSIIALNVTAAKIENRAGATKSTSTGTSDYNSVTPAECVNTGAFVTTGKTVAIWVEHDATSNDGYLGATNSGGNAEVNFILKRDTTIIGIYKLQTSGTSIKMSPGIYQEDQVAAGTYTYRLFYQGAAVNDHALAYYMKLCVQEKL